MNAWKIDSNSLEIYEMVNALFSVNDKDEKFCFFEETFLLADGDMDVALRMLFLILSNVKAKLNN